MKILFIVITLLASLHVYAQKPKSSSGEKARLEREITALEAELEALESSNNPSVSNEFNSICYEKTLYTSLKPMSDKQFYDFCSQELSRLQDIPSNVDVQIISSCRQEGDGVTASFCVFSNPNVNTVVNEQAQLSKEKELVRIQNTKKMYQDMIDALDKEIAANKIEIVDHGGNLVLKHLNTKKVKVLRPILQKYKDKEIAKLKENYGIGGRENIENENAEILDEYISDVEKIASLIPEGDKLTLHYLWRIFKSVPDAGRMLGNGAAAINIVFQKNEYVEKLKELEQREQQLLHN